MSDVCCLLDTPAPTRKFSLGASIVGTLFAPAGLQSQAPTFSTASSGSLRRRSSTETVLQFFSEAAHCLLHSFLQRWPTKQNICSLLRLCGKACYGVGMHLGRSVRIEKSAIHLYKQSGLASAGVKMIQHSFSGLSDSFLQIALG